MSLSNELVTEFVKVVRDNTTTGGDQIAYGTVKMEGNQPYVQLDGSEVLTPVITTTDVVDGERVCVTIKDHTAMINGNVTSPAARTDDVKDITNVVAYKVTTTHLDAFNASIDNLYTKLANIDKLQASEAYIDELKAEIANLKFIKTENLDALNAKINSLEAEIGKFDSIEADDLDVLNAEIANLKGYTAEFTKLSADTIVVKKLEADWANLDTVNIDKARIEALYIQSGLIQNSTMEDVDVTGELVGVVIRGDRIIGNCIKADQLLLKGPDGLYYRMNINAFDTDENGNPIIGVDEVVHTEGLDGRVIVADSVTADKIHVSDLSAFGATIGGFKLNDSSIHSFTKDDVNSGAPGVYFDNDGQFSVGDGRSFVKFYKISDAYEDENGNRVDASYKLGISADSIIFGPDSDKTLSKFENVIDYVKIGKTETGSPCIELSDDNSPYNFSLTHNTATFRDNENNVDGTKITPANVMTESIYVGSGFHQGGYVWRTRRTGNLGLIWKGGS